MSAQVDLQYGAEGAGIAGASVPLLFGTPGIIAGAQAGTGLLGIGLTSGMALPLIGIGVAIAALILQLFHGADPREEPAAQMEQIFEAAADNLYALQKAGILTAAQSVAAMQELITAGQNLETQYSGQLGPWAAKAAANLTSVIQAEFAAAEALPATVGVVSPTLAIAQRYYLKPGLKGWYAASLTQAGKITDQFVTTFISQDQAAAASNPVTTALSSLTTAATSALASLTGTSTKAGTNWTLLLIIAVGGWLAIRYFRKAA